jgi:uncharacterized membrane protein
MMRALSLLALASAIGSGVIAGVFFIFSVCVMKSLRALPSACGIAAMQTINIVIVNPWFLSMFLGTALTSLAAVALSVLSPAAADAASAAGTLAGGVLYVVGVLLVTMRFNVPLNDGLARISPQGGDAARLWDDYLARWTVWNHVRTLAALLACLSFALAHWRGLW